MNFMKDQVDSEISKQNGVKKSSSSLGVDKIIDEKKELRQIDIIKKLILESIVKNVLLIALLVAVVFGVIKLGSFLLKML